MYMPFESVLLSSPLKEMLQAMMYSTNVHILLCVKQYRQSGILIIGYESSQPKGKL